MRGSKIMLRSLRLLIATAMVVSAGVALAAEGQPGPEPVYTNDGPAADPAKAALLQKAEAEGRIRVIVGLSLRMVDEDRLTPTEAAAQARRLQTMQNAVLGRTVGGAFGGRGVIRYETIPYFALSVTPAELRRLYADPDVTVIQEDTPLEPMLDKSVPMIKADQLWKRGFKGSGYKIAVLDSGVERTHPMLAGKVVSEACFGINDANKLESFCPGKVEKAFGKGVARPCSVAGCDHGTHVASIAAGSTKGHVGVARSANIIAVQVFTKGLTANICNPGAAPCMTGRQSLLVKGLERVYALRKSYKIAAVNLSLGGGSYAASCNGSEPATTDILRKLANAGIAVFAASGNDGNNTHIDQPACITHAIPVGSTSSAAPTVAQSSNLWTNYLLAAPGVGIEAAVPGKGYADKSGTSMATPHVAGLAALLRSARPDATPADLKRALKCGAVPATTGRTPNTDYALVQGLGAWRWILKDFPESIRFDFTNQQMVEWDVVNGKWSTGSGRLQWKVPDAINKWGAIVYPSCRDHVVFEARVRRLDPYASWGGDPRTYPQMGILFSAEVKGSPQRLLSGYWFYYHQDPWHEGFLNAGVYKIENWDAKSDTYPTSTGVAGCFKEKFEGSLKGYNRLKVVSRGSAHAVYLNGAQVCSFDDGSLAAWSVGFLSNQPNADEPDHKFQVDWATIKALKSGSPEAADIAAVERERDVIDIAATRSAEHESAELARRQAEGRHAP